MLFGLTLEAMMKLSFVKASNWKNKLFTHEQVQTLLWDINKGKHCRTLSMELTLFLAYCRASSCSLWFMRKCFTFWSILNAGEDFWDTLWILVSIRDETHEVLCKHLQCRDKEWTNGWGFSTSLCQYSFQSLEFSAKGFQCIITPCNVH